MNTTSQQTPIRGYKVTDAKMRCRGFQYEIGKEYVHQGKIQHCVAGFHFCINANHCFDYYDFKRENRVFEVDGYGEMLTEGDKTVCSHIKLIRELTWQEVLVVANTGKDNTGRGNSGYRNSGNWNSGDRNSGDSNSGYRNSGNWNSGDRNSGDSNSGYRNSGNWNSGYSNSGYSNSGYSNSGNWNSGNSNSGDWNSGDRNSGDSNSGYRNSGDSNSGDRNSGDSNSGYRNSGNWNSGDRNSGDSNSGYRNSGAFCTDENPPLLLFNKPTKMTVKEWEEHRAVSLMGSIDPTIWVPASAMSDKEKEQHPKWETTDGYLKTISMKEAWANAWNNWTDENKAVFTSLPNFDVKIFEQITGIKVNPQPKTKANVSKRAKKK
jgi:hypothetical protein